MVRAAVVALAWTALGAAALAGTLGVPWNRVAPWRVEAGLGTAGPLGPYVSLDRLGRLEEGLQVFYLDAGTFPDDLAPLALQGYVSPETLVDPWGRPYAYRVSAGGYQLQGHDPEGNPSPELRVSRRFSSGQRMLLPDE
jgi:hypothetical protein